MDLLIFGYFATFFSAVSFLPQAIKTIKTRDVTGLSLLTYICLFLAFTVVVYLWCCVK